MKKYTYPATLLCDFYKVSHKDQYPKGTEELVSTWTPRTSRIKGINRVVAFGFQAFIKEFLINYFNKNFFSRPKQEVLNEYKRVIKYTLGVEAPDASHIEQLHELGYLPIHIKAVKEGTLVPIKVPMLTIENTKPEFFWLTNYLETLMSAQLWMPTTSATLAFEYRHILESYAKKTNGDTSGVPFQGHDFSMRGMSSLEAAKASGAGHLLSFTGTDTIPAIMYLEEYYNADIEKELVGTSIPATEHSVMCANGTNEYEVIKRFITEIYPKGFVSIVSDTWDFWHLVTNVYPLLKKEIMERDGRVVIRPDSGDPVEIMCGKFISEFDSIDEATDILFDEMRDEASNDCEGSYNVGSDQYERLCKVKDKYYKVIAEFEYNRHDKTYYYVDYSKVKSVEEFTPTVEELGLIEKLWNTFGGTITEKGYKQLDSHIGVIYGDAITIERCKEICKRLEEKGFASTNMVYGIGSFTYQYNTRDTFGFALKSTYALINGVEQKIQKDPATDKAKIKKSQAGLVAVIEKDGAIDYVDNLSREEQQKYKEVDLLQDVFVDGKLVREESLQDIRKRVLSNL
ncbi:nicotinate phosphoribosyltransferase [Brevibacillus laterosporus]|nr:nicotinate phosphoribosyltransferase [Brevibacillus laterosporus]TPG68585.1 nicotinate phosphoribosyltransferase [Brevibacillus laterosporus]